MADNKKWFKVWTSILIDEIFEDLPDEYIGVWTRLGARTALTGNRGTVRFKSMQRLIDFLRVKDENEAINLLNKLPNVSLNGAIKMQKSDKKSAKNVQKNTSLNDYGEITVTFKNWNKYQVDSTQAERQKKSRSKKRGEEKREEEKRYSPESVKLSGLLAKLILDNNPDYLHLQKNKYQKTIEKYSHDIDKLIRIDGADPVETEKVINWCQSDSFWKDNILSGEKLRKQYPQLKIKMNSSNNNSTSETEAAPYHNKKL